MAPSPPVQLGLLTEKGREHRGRANTQVQPKHAAGMQLESTRTRPARTTPAPWLRQYSPAHSTQADQLMCTAGKEDFKDFSLPLNMLCPIPPSFSSSYIGGAATKINKTHSFVIPRIFPHQGCWQETWPGFGKDCAGLVVVHTTHHCPVLPHTRTWHCLTSYTRSTSTGERAVQKES